MNTFFFSPLTVILLLLKMNVTQFLGFFSPEEIYRNTTLQLVCHLPLKKLHQNSW